MILKNYIALVMCMRTCTPGVDSPLKPTPPIDVGAGGGRGAEGPVLSYSPLAYANMSSDGADGLLIGSGARLLLMVAVRGPASSARCCFLACSSARVRARSGCSCWLSEEQRLMCSFPNSSNHAGPHLLCMPQTVNCLPRNPACQGKVE